MNPEPDGKRLSQISTAWSLLDQFDHMLRGYRRMSWEPELDELARREALAREMGGEERVARQHAS